MKKSKKLLTICMTVLMLTTMGAFQNSFAYRLALDVWNPDGTLLWTTCLLSGGTCLPTVIVR